MPMRCEQIRELLGAYHDQELDSGERRDVAAHLETCANCNATANEIDRIGRRLAAAGREPTPRDLRARVTAALAMANTRSPSGMVRILGVYTSSLLRQAAVLAFACALTALATAMVFSRAEKGALLEREIVSAHVRSLLQESPIQVASSDTHTVKPWFSGRVDFSPPVKDLTAEGFPLVGGRVDYVGERRVAALVYRRHLHVVNVFLWPSGNAEEGGPSSDALKGYNVLVWNSAGITYWAVSDLNGDELRQLQRLFQ
jgi:anti-sigma factor RsiW